MPSPSLHKHLLFTYHPHNQFFYWIKRSTPALRFHYTTRPCRPYCLLNSVKQLKLFRWFPYCVFYCCKSFSFLFFFNNLLFVISKVASCNFLCFCACSNFTAANIVGQLSSKIQNCSHKLDIKEETVERNIIKPQIL